MKYNQSTCLDEDSSFFIQYTCTQDNEQLAEKREEGAVVSSIAVFSCLFFLIMIFYLRQTSQIHQVTVDVDTLTAGDYTVDLRISPQQFRTFVN